MYVKAFDGNHRTEASQSLRARSPELRCQIITNENPAVREERMRSWSRGDVKWSMISPAPAYSFMILSRQTVRVRREREKRKQEVQTTLSLSLSTVAMQWSNSDSVRVNTMTYCRHCYCYLATLPSKTTSQWWAWINTVK